MDVRMKLAEAKISMKKLREIQKETDDLLGIGGKKVTTGGVGKVVIENNGESKIRKTLTLKERIKMEKRIPYKICFDGVPISDRIRNFPKSIQVSHARQTMPPSSILSGSSGRLARDIVVVSSVEARSLRSSY
jgi:hypothetical protein